MMELHERLTSARPIVASGGRDPFAEVKNRIHLAVIGDLGPQLFATSIDPFALRERVTAEIETRLGDEPGISRDDRERIAGEIAADILGHGPLERLLADDAVTEIMVNGPHEIWVERGGQLYETPVRFNDESHLRRIINKMVAQVGRRIDEQSPMVDARLPDGSRVNAIIPPLSLSGALVTIRKFSRRRLTLDDMVRMGTLSAETVEFLDRCIRAQLNMLISGGTCSGKTTLLTSLSTVHANSPRDALARIEAMVLMAGIDLPVRAIREQVSSALEAVVHLERLEDGSRRVTSIAEVQRMESDVVTMQELFKYQIDE